MATKIQIRMDESMHERWVRAAGEVPLGRWVKLRIEEIVGGQKPVAQNKAEAVVAPRPTPAPGLARPLAPDSLAEQVKRRREEMNREGS